MLNPRSVYTVLYIKCKVIKNVNIIKDKAKEYLTSSSLDIY